MTGRSDESMAVLEEQVIGILKEPEADAVATDLVQ